MLMGEIAPGRRADILATDISQEVLDQARSGRYSQFAVNRGLPARFLAQHFRRCGLEWELDAELRRCVTFKLLNLAQPFPAIPPMDLVLMRNVLIYFDPATKRDVLRRVRRVLAPGGWLVLGTAETTSGIDDEFEIVRLQRTTAYRVRAN
jgi:chemotaxis protein methyltransferase CheR